MLREKPRNKEKSIWPLAALLGCTILTGFVLVPSYVRYQQDQRIKEIKRANEEKQEYDYEFNLLFGDNGLADLDKNRFIDKKEYSEACRRGGFLGEVGLQKPSIENLQRARWSYLTENMAPEELQKFGGLR